MKKVICPYCGKPAALVDSIEIYGVEYGHKCYLCRPCDAYVGCHKGTVDPLGNLANAELRLWRKAAHNAFDPVWRFGTFRGRRKAAYKWLAERMALPVEQTHIGMFNADQCRQVIDIIDGEIRERNLNYGRP